MLERNLESDLIVYGETHNVEWWCLWSCRRRGPPGAPSRSMPAHPGTCTESICKSQHTTLTYVVILRVNFISLYYYVPKLGAKPSFGCFIVTLRHRSIDSEMIENCCVFRCRKEHCHMFEGHQVILDDLASIKEPVFNISLTQYCSC